MIMEPDIFGKELSSISFYVCPADQKGRRNLAVYQFYRTKENEIGPLQMQRTWETGTLGTGFCTGFGVLRVYS